MRCWTLIGDKKEQRALRGAREGGKQRHKPLSIQYFRVSRKAQDPQFGRTNLEDLNDSIIGCTCQYDCPGSNVPVQIRVEPATLEWSTHKWSFQHANTLVLYEPILRLANGYCQWLREDPVWLY